MAMSREAQLAGIRQRRRFSRAFAEYREAAAHAADAARYGPPQDRDQLATAEAMFNALGQVAAAGQLVVPPAGPILGGTQVVSRSLGATAGSIAKGRKKGLGETEYRGVVDPERAVIEAFAHGLQRLSRHSPVVLILDTAEILGEMRIPLFHLLRRCSGGTTWVVSMRLDPDAMGAVDEIGTLYLRSASSRRFRAVAPSNFTLDDIDSYLTGTIGHLPEGVTASRVLDLTAGVPLAVRITADALRAGMPPDELLGPLSRGGDVSVVISELAERYLVHVSSLESEARVTELDHIFGLALMQPPYQDPELLAAIWDVSTRDVAQLRSSLRANYEFVVGRDARLHSDVQRVIRVFLLRPDMRAFVESANRRAIALLEERIKEFDKVPLEGCLHDDSWARTARLLVWHKLWCSPIEGTDYVQQLISWILPCRPALADEFLQQTDFFRETMPDHLRSMLADIRVLESGGSSLIGRIRQAFASTPHAAELQTERARSAFRSIQRAGAGSPNLREVSREEIDDAIRLICWDVLHLSNEETEQALAGLGSLVARSPASSELARRVVAAARQLRDMDDMRGEGSVTLRTHAGRLVVRSAEPSWIDFARLASLELRLDSVGNALTLVDRALEMNNTAPEVHSNRAIVLGRLERHEEALMAFQTAIELDPGSALLHSNRAIVLGRLERHEEALMAFQTAIELDPGSASLHSNRAIVLGRLERHEEALQEWGRALVLEPGDASTLANRAVTLAKLRRYEEVVEACDAILTFNPADAGVHANRGFALCEIGRYEDALRDLNHARDLDPAIDAFPVTRAICMIRTGATLGNALAEMNQALGDDPENTRAMFNKALVLNEAKQWDEAADCLKRLISIDEQYPMAIANLADAYFSLRRDADAREMVELSLETGEHLEPLILLAVLWLHDDRDRARSLAERALQCSGDPYSAARAGELYAVAHLIGGDIDAALHRLREAFGSRDRDIPLQEPLYDLLLEAEVPGAAEFRRAREGAVA